MKEKLFTEKVKHVIVEIGFGQKIFKRNSKGQIVFDEEGRLDGECGYPYVTLRRDVVANEHDINELVESVLPK